MKTVEIALTQYGVNEKHDKEIHPQIVKYLEAIGCAKNDLKRNTSWSSAFVNWVVKNAGYEYSGKLDVRSWLSVGESIGSPSFGDIVVLSENEQDHVGIFIKETKRYIYLIGGDQRNKVCIKAYAKSCILDFRKLKKIA
ncbi:TIGR02594 family protein [Pseudotenacibaculum sp. MALMAid0570]|uniref:TIGR02594 family protein n=1 Tax=Pseudotenacibaculum sp. MALMAid0570 TaxID=3143938 RepID=UPI0032DF68EB